jgi:transcription initiation factor TFIIIB Brf1 subunit/transcription initiation factor TFIIB
MVKVRGYDCMCPVCGHMNYSVDLNETSGEMECEKCGLIVTVQRPFQNYTFSEETISSMQKIDRESKAKKGRGILHMTIGPSPEDLLEVKKKQRIAV